MLSAGAKQGQNNMADQAAHRLWSLFAPGTHTVKSLPSPQSSTEDGGGRTQQLGRRTF